MYTTMVDAFTQNVAQADPNMCWLWQGITNTDGRVQLGQRNTTQYTLRYPHRIAWEVINGPLPDGFYVHHTCTMRLCCNPIHLILTQSKKKHVPNYLRKTSKKCARCLQVLPADQFYPYRRKLSSYCKQCHNKRSQELQYNKRTNHRATTLSDYLAKHITSGLPDVCWPWQGRKTLRGYGEARFANTRYSAHVFAYINAFGPITEGLFVLHTCDNPPCCNPSHLWLGTAADNNADRAKKGRSYTHITPNDVKTIRRLRSEGLSYNHIAKQLGISYGTVFNAAKPHTHPYVKD